MNNFAAFSQNLLNMAMAPVEAVIAFPQRLTQTIVGGSQEVVQTARGLPDPMAIFEQTARGLNEFFRAPFQAIAPPKEVETVTSGSEYVGGGPPYTTIF